MIKGYYARIADFLSQYSTTAEGDRIPPNPIYIRSAIEVLINERIFTKEELKQEAIRTHDVIIRDDLFPTEVHEHD